MLLVEKTPFSLDLTRQGLLLYYDGTRGERPGVLAENEGKMPRELLTRGRTFIYNEDARNTAILPLTTIFKRKATLCIVRSAAK